MTQTKERRRASQQAHLAEEAREAEAKNQEALAIASKEDAKRHREDRQSARSAAGETRAAASGKAKEAAQSALKTRPGIGEGANPTNRVTRGALSRLRLAALAI